jgi:hypothetical protein
MDKNGPSALRIYYWRPGIRALLGIICAALTGFFAWGLIASIDYQIHHPDNRLPLLEQFFSFSFLVMLNLFLILTTIAIVRAGRLVLDREQAWLPRIPLGPWGVLKPHELRYAQVQQYGLGMVWQRGQPFSPVLLFELKSGAGATRGHKLRLGLRWYDDADYKAILEAFASHIGYGPESLQNNGLGDVQFERPQGMQQDSPKM